METISLPEAEILYAPHFLSEAESRRLFTHFKDQTGWLQQDITMFGKTMKEPRLTAWYGDAAYTYSGITMQPNAWTKELIDLKSKIEITTKALFNSVLLNWYRNGNDYMGWHSDDEKELGQNPAIASLSLGASRSFILRRKEDHSKKIYFELHSGSLLVMQGKTQHFWQHQLPKRLKVKTSRINLTFRHIKS